MSIIFKTYSSMSTGEKRHRRAFKKRRKAHAKANTSEVVTIKPKRSGLSSEESDNTKKHP